MRALPLQATPAKKPKWTKENGPVRAEGRVGVESAALNDGAERLPKKALPDRRKVTARPGRHAHYARIARPQNFPADAGGGTLRTPCLQRCGVRFFSKNLKPTGPGCACKTKTPAGQTLAADHRSHTHGAKHSAPANGPSHTATQPCPPMVDEADYRTMSPLIKTKTP